MSPGSTPRLLVVGVGRAGGSFADALGDAGWDVATVHHGDAPAASAAGDHDMVLLCVPDPAVAQLAARLAVRSSVVVAHCAGSLGLDVLAPHPRVASVHPLVALADRASGAQRLRGAWFGIAGDPVVEQVVDALGGRAVQVADEDRTIYHAAAVVASNHLVALMGQVQRLAESVDVPLEAYLDLAVGALANVVATDPATALTGPVARGDWATVRRHLDALPEQERDAYRTLAEHASRLVDPDG
ncbi:MAG: Rossmann-like and DUF2520 domain-containing protein [Microthrixaceae bacterium]